MPNTLAKNLEEALKEARNNLETDEITKAIYGYMDVCEEANHLKNNQGQVFYNSSEFDEKYRTPFMQDLLLQSRTSKGNLFHPGAKEILLAFDNHIPSGEEKTNAEVEGLEYLRHAHAYFGRARLLYFLKNNVERERTLLNPKHPEIEALLKTN